MAEGNKPGAKFRLGNVSATIWRNGDFFNVTISRSYKDNGEWKETDQLNGGDLMNAVRVLQRAEDFISAQ